MLGGTTRVVSFLALSGRFTEVTVGEGFACGLRTNGRAACWGDDSSNEADPPSATFTQISVGGYILADFACGVRTTGNLACWGDNTYGETSPAPEESHR